MMRKKTFSFFLLMVMAIQTIPVMEMGEALCKGRFTEEIPQHNADVDKDGDGKSVLNKIEYLTVPHSCSVTNYENIVSAYFHYAIGIPQNYATDILVPPPNDSYCHSNVI